LLSPNAISMKYGAKVNWLMLALLLLLPRPGRSQGFADELAELRAYCPLPSQADSLRARLLRCSDRPEQVREWTRHAAYLARAKAQAGLPGILDLRMSPQQAMATADWKLSRIRNIERLDKEQRLRVWQTIAGYELLCAAWAIPTARLPLELVDLSGDHAPLAVSDDGRTSLAPIPSVETFYHFLIEGAVGDWRYGADDPHDFLILAMAEQEAKFRAEIDMTQVHPPTARYITNRVPGHPFAHAEVFREYLRFDPQGMPYFQHHSQQVQFMHDFMVLCKQNTWDRQFRAVTRYNGASDYARLIFRKAELVEAIVKTYAADYQATPPDFGPTELARVADNFCVSRQQIGQIAASGRVGRAVVTQESPADASLSLSLEPGVQPEQGAEPLEVLWPSTGRRLTYFVYQPEQSFYSYFQSMENLWLAVNYHNSLMESLLAMVEPKLFVFARGGALVGHFGEFYLLAANQSPFWVGISPTQLSPLPGQKVFVPNGMPIYLP